MKLNQETGNATEGVEIRESERLMHSSREEEIRHRAYEIYLARGEEQGCDIDDWLQAERELTAE